MKFDLQSTRWCITVVERIIERNNIGSISSRNNLRGVYKLLRLLEIAFVTKKLSERDLIAIKRNESRLKSLTNLSGRR